MSTSSGLPRFGRLVTAMVTPFDDAGALDVDAAVELARWLADGAGDKAPSSLGASSTAMIRPAGKVAHLDRR